jgi:hypothetical protein
MKLTTMGVDLEIKQAGLILMRIFMGKLQHRAQKNTEDLYNLSSVSQLVEFVRIIFVVKYCQAKHLHILIRIKPNRLLNPEHIRKFNNSYIFWKSEIYEEFLVYIFWSGLRSGPLRAYLMSTYGLRKVKLLFEL